MASLTLEINIRDLAEAKLLIYEICECYEWLKSREGEPGQSPDVREARYRLERALKRYSLGKGEKPREPRDP